MMMKRRTAERLYPRRERIAWGAASSGVLRSARVVDVSDSGISFSIIGNANVQHGDAIRTLSPSGDAPRHARVVRVEQATTEAKFGPTTITRLGCRWMTSTDRREHTHQSAERGSRSTPSPL